MRTYYVYIMASRSRVLCTGVTNDLARRVNAVLFSPAFSKDASGARNASNCLLDPQELAEWMLEDNVRARLGLQIHKLIWDPALKGV